MDETRGAIHCGSLLLTFIPILFNGRVGRAYERALGAAPGAQALAEVTLTERWIFWVFGITRCTSISGVGVQ